MARKMGLCSRPTYLAAIFCVWFTNCHAWPFKSANNTPISNGHGTAPSFTTGDPLSNRKETRALNIASSMFPKRNKRDISDSNINFDLFPAGAQSADDAVQKLLSLFTSTRPKITVGADDYDNGFYDPPIDIFSKRPGNVRNTWTTGSTKSKTNKDVQSANGEEPTGPPIVLYQHRMAKKSPHQVIPEIFLREAATSLRTQPDPKIMRNLIERIVLSKQLPPQNNDDGNRRFYSMGQLLEHSSKLDEDIPTVSRLLL